jgi:hypothetical protein
MALDINSFMNEMAKFEPEQFEKGTLLLRKKENKFEIVERNPLIEKEIRVSPQYKIENFAANIAQALIQAQNVDQKKLEECKSKYFALLKHAYIQKHSPKGIQKLFEAIQICETPDPQKKAEEELENHIGKERFEHLKMSNFQEKIRRRHELLQKSIDTGLAPPAEHFEKNFLELMQKSLEAKKNENYFLLAKRDSLEDVTKFSHTFPPVFANKLFAESLWNEFLQWNQLVSARFPGAIISFHDFLARKQEIIEENSFKNLAACLQGANINTLERAYLTSLLLLRLSAQISEQEIQAAEKSLGKTFEKLKTTMRDFQERIPKALVEAQNIICNLKKIASMQQQGLYKEEIERLEKTVAELLDLKQFLWPEKELSKLPHLDPKAEFETIRTALATSKKRVEQIKEELEEKISNAINDAKKTSRELQKITGKRLHVAYEEDFKQIESTIAEFQNIKSFLSEEKAQEAPRVNFTSALEHLQKSKEKIKQLQEGKDAKILEQSFLRELKETIEKQQSGLALVGLPQGCPEAIAKFAEALPPMPHNAQQELIVGLFENFKKSNLPLEKFLEEKQKIVKEESFKALAAVLQKKELKPLHKWYLSSLITGRLDGTFTKEVLQEKAASLPQTFQGLDTFAENIKRAIKQKISDTINSGKEALKTLYEKNTDLFYRVNQIEFQDIELIISQLEDMQYFFWPEEHPAKFATQTYRNPLQNFEALKTELEKSIKTLQEKAKKKEGLEERSGITMNLLTRLKNLGMSEQAFMTTLEQIRDGSGVSLHLLKETLTRCIEEQGEAPDELSQALLKRFNLKTLIKFAKGLPPELATKTFADSLWDTYINDYHPQELSFEEFLIEKQKVLDDPTFRKIIPSLQDKYLNYDAFTQLKQECLLLVTTCLIASSDKPLPKKQLKEAKEKLENAKVDSETLLSKIHEKLPKDFKENISKTVDFSKKELTNLQNLASPLFSELYKEDFERIKNLISSLTDMHNFLWPKESSSEMALGEYMEPEKNFKECQEELQVTLERVKQKIVDFEQNKKATLQENSKIFQKTLSRMEEKSRKILEDAIKGKDLSSLLLHPAFSDICDVLRLSRKDPINAHIQDICVVQIKAYCKGKGASIYDSLPENFKDLRESYGPLLEKHKEKYETLLSILAKMAPGAKERLQKAIQGREIVPILTHPKFSQICDILKLSRENPIDAQVQDMVISRIRAFCTSENPDISNFIPDNFEQVIADFRKHVSKFQRENTKFLSIISRMAPGIKESLEKEIQGKDLIPILSHPGFVELCIALQLSRENPIDRAVQDTAVYWILRYLKAKNREQKLYRYIYEDAEKRLEKLREDLTEYEATLEKTKNTISSYIKELEEILKTKGEVLSRAPKIKKKDPKIYAEEFLKALKKNYDQLGKIKEYDINQPFALASGMEKKMNDIRKASGKP